MNTQIKQREKEIAQQQQQQQQEVQWEQPNDDINSSYVVPPPLVHLNRYSLVEMEYILQLPIENLRFIPNK